MKTLSLTIFAFMLISISFGQSSSDNNNPFGTNHLGWDDPTNAPLRINQNNTERLHFTSLPLWTGLNGITQTNVARVQLSLNANTYSPWSLLHLREGFLVSTMQRNWFNVGTTYIANRDLMYCGLMERPGVGVGTDRTTDAVIAWGCQDEDDTENPLNVDNFRIIFLQSTTGLDDAASNQGREMMRISPLGKVGLGDFSNNGFGINQQPTHRLDVLGTARLRSMPNSSPQVLITGVEEDAVGDYSLNYLSFSGNQNEYLAGDGTWQDVGSTLCEWDVNAGDLSTGYVGACNDGDVGIGLANPNAKLHVLRNETTAQNIGIKLDVNGGNTMEGLWVQSFPNGNTNVARGIRVEQVAQTSTSINYGINSRVSWGEKVVGVLGQASQGSVVNIGVGGLVVGGQSSSNHIGIYGEATIPGYFVGSIWTSAPTYNLSDENFKQNISEDMPGLETILELKPRTYEYRSEEFSFMNLPQGEQYGLIAQEVQETLPSLVKAGAKPEMTDPETGELISEGIEHLGVDYQSLIPILIKATQEQQELIDQQAAQINDLMDVVSACCSADTKSNETEDFNIFMDVKQTALDQNYPNPFQRTTTISYTVGCACEAQVVILDQAGRIIETFNNGAKEAGDYQFQWDASNLESGIYFYSLIVDGQEYVKRALKL